MQSLLAWGLAQGANALNIIAGVIVAHLASPSDFARFATLSAALAIISAALNPMINEIAQRVSIHRGLELLALRSRSYIAVCAAIVISICACASIVTSGLDALLIYLLIPVAFVAQSWVLGILYGLHRMVASGAVLCVAGVARVVTLGALISVGAAFTGATISYLIYFLITVLCAPYLLSVHLKKSGETSWDTNWRLIIGFFLLSLPFSVDQPIVQALFTDISADYAALMTYARSVMLLASPALTIVYSASLQRDSENVATAKESVSMIKTLTILSSLAFGLAAILWIVHPFLFPLLLGDKYLHVTPNLALALAAIALHVISYFLVQRLLLSCSWRLCAVLAIPFILQAILLASLKSPSISDLTSTAVAVLTTQTLIALWATTRDHSRRKD
jgi:O-antigen/teichoic acid export membrane protein